MKVALLITDKGKQVIFTPETELDKEVIKMFVPKSSIEIAFKQGSFIDRYENVAYSFNECQGGWIRGWEKHDNLMLIIKETEESKKIADQ